MYSIPYNSMRRPELEYYKESGERFKGFGIHLLPKEKSEIGEFNGLSIICL